MNRTHGRRWFGWMPSVLALILVAIAAALAVPSSARAAGAGTLRVEAASVTGVGVGDTFTVRVVSNAAGVISGASASVVFDKTKLQVTALAKGANWVIAGAGYAGYPTTLNTATFIANANAGGKIPVIAAFFVDGSTTLAAGDHDLYSLTFRALAAGVTNLTLPVGAFDGAMLDGAVATYGDTLSVTSTGGTVTVVAKPTAAMFSLPTWVLASALPVRWTGTPAGAAIVSYDVRYRRAAWNGVFGAPVTWLAATALTTSTFTLPVGWTYCFSVRALDAAAVTSNWSAETCTAMPLDDRSLSRAGSWTLGSSATYYRSTYLRSSSLNAKLTRTSVKARRIAIVATTCSTCGSIKVYWGTTLLKTISLHSATTVNRKLITVTTFTSVRTGTLSIRVITSGKKVIIDGLAIRAT